MEDRHPLRGPRPDAGPPLKHRTVHTPSRRVAPNGVISVAWQEISCGKYRGGHRVDVHLQGEVMQIWDGDELIKTVLRTNDKEVRKKRAARAS